MVTELGAPRHNPMGLCENLADRFLGYVRSDPTGLIMFGGGSALWEPIGVPGVKPSKVRGPRCDALGPFPSLLAEVALTSPSASPEQVAWNNHLAKKLVDRTVGTRDQN